MSYFTNENGDIKFKAVIKMVIGIILILIIGFPILFGTWGTVKAGERGIMLRFKATTGKVLEPGFYFKLPYIEKVKTIDVQIQKESADLDAASKDLQTVTSKVALNYHLDPKKVVIVYKDVGTDYNQRLIDPALQESLKASTAQFTAEELIQKREQARQVVKDLLTQKLTPHGIIVDEFNVVNFKFSPTFETAIEAKVTTEQNALAAKNKLDQVKYEAEQRIAQAKGEAEAIRIQAQAITQQGGADYVKLKAIEKWKGEVPHYVGTGSAIPFLQVP